MAQETQTLENGLKPYGLVYQLIIVEGIPVQWAINPSKAKGVVIDGPLAAGFSAPVQKQSTSWPRAILDEQTAGKLVVPFYDNAEVPVFSYVTAGNPPMLTSCGDVYVLPHADPQDWTTASGYFAALPGFVAANGPARPSIWPSPDPSNIP